MKGDSKHFRRNGGKIAEHRALREVNRRYFGVDSRFSAVNRRSCRRLAAKKGPVNFTPNKYNPFPYHYTHDIIVFRLSRGLQLQLSGVFQIN